MALTWYPQQGQSREAFLRVLYRAVAQRDDLGTIREGLLTRIALEQEMPRLIGRLVPEPLVPELDTIR
ncbi:hypothetical protein [Georgenia ruanii]|uniref:hypothetical protein n=1 Tax=Georgenia ruanii TaxID=348442 RepID=UPI00126470C9|nr:hypothetical protein [Georgenia ruanii]